METFVYKATLRGKLITGEMDGKDQEEIIRKLHEKRYEVLSIKSKAGEGKKKKSTLKKGKLLGFGNKVKKVDKVFLYKNFSTMLIAGLPLTETIDLLGETVKNKKLKEILGQLRYDVEGGGAISVSFGKYPNVFGSSETSMIRAGEVGGSLPKIFNDLYEDMNSEYQLQKDITGAMMYPAIILSILLLVVLLLLLFVLPQFTSFFTQANIEIPMITKVIMAASAFLKKYFVFIIIFFVATFIGTRLGIKRSTWVKGFFDKWILKIPFIGHNLKLFYIYKFARMLSLLIKSGVPILEALEIVRDSMTHTGYRKSVEVIRKDVKLGGKLHKSVGKYEHLYPIFVSRMIKVGDKTGKSSDALQNISEFYQKELKETLGNMSTLIEPILMVVLGFGVAFIAISVLLPMYKIVSGINQMQQ